MALDLHVAAEYPDEPTGRHQSGQEELANALSHALGFAIALAVWPALSHAAQRQWGMAGTVSVTLFCMTMAMQYLASTVYHALPHGRAKLWARAVDHAAIFVFIAGSSTPFTLVAMGGLAGAATCALVWALALAGAALKLQRRLTGRRMSTGLYLLLAWLAMVVAWPGLSTLDPVSLGWLLGGTVAYLIGTAFFVFDSALRFGHFVWHLFVLAGSGCHLCAAMWPALG